MILLDTDHMSVFRFGDGEQAVALRERLRTSGDPFIATSIITFEEQMRGWMADVARVRTPLRQILAYEQLMQLTTIYRNWNLVGYDHRAATEFVRLRRELGRIGPQDLKIAAIVLVQSALLLSANLRDFRQVSGLRVENWLEPDMAAEEE